ncbi:MAG: murein hydrolase activator EnvC [Acidimicrobiia bacterium]
MRHRPGPRHLRRSPAARRLQHLARLGFVVCLVVGLAQPGSLGAVAAGTASASLGRNDPFGVLGPGAADPDRPDADGTGLLLRGDGSTAVLTELQQGVAQLAPAAAVALPLDQLDAAVDELDRQIAFVGAQVANARGQLAVVEVDRARLDVAIAETQRRIDDLEARVAEEAISLYISPRADALEVFTSAGDLDSSVRRQGLVRSLLETGERATDQLRIAQQDLLELRAAFDQVNGTASALRGGLDGAEQQLDAATGRRAELALTLAERVAALDAEIIGLAQGEAQLVRVLSQTELAAEEQASRRLSMPIDAPITSEFGTRWGRMHNGVDFESDIGVPIYAAKSGVVIEADWMDGYGQVTVIDHGGGLTTLYAHQSAFEVSAGDHVERGQLIGYVGVTGNSTGPHLHFETRESGAPVDPRKYLS